MANQPLASEVKDWSIAAIKLLQGVVYSDEIKVWDILLRSRSSLDSFFGRLGLAVLVDEVDGYAYLRQYGLEELPEEHEHLPRLMRRTPLGYAATVLCVLLRDELRRFEEEEVHNERCVIETDSLFEQWRTFFPVGSDEVRRRKELAAALTKAADAGFVVRFAEDPEAWEIRRAIKARLPIDELEKLRDQLAAAATERIVGGKDD